MGINMQTAIGVSNIEITDTQIAQIIANNLPDDIIGVENDIRDLMNQQNPRNLQVNIHVTSLNPFTAIPFIGEDLPNL